MPLSTRREFSKRTGEIRIEGGEPPGRALSRRARQKGVAMHRRQKIGMRS
jgi:hypothetical protein